MVNGHQMKMYLFLKLVDVRDGGNLLVLSQIDIEENLGSETQKSNLNNEIKIIKELREKS